MAKVVTNEVRFSYTHLWEPQAINGSEPKYSVSLIIPKKDTETIKAIKEAIETAKKDGIAKFVETVRYFQDDYPITLLFTTVSDKDFKDMIQKICNGLHFSNVYVTEIWGSRKQSSTELAELFRENGCKQVYAEPDCEKAFELAYAKKGDGLLFVVGSLYLVGEIKDYLKRRNK